MWSFCNWRASRAGKMICLRSPERLVTRPRHKNALRSGLVDYRVSVRPRAGCCVPTRRHTLFVSATGGTSSCVAAAEPIVLCPFGARSVWNPYWARCCTWRSPSLFFPSCVVPARATVCTVFGAGRRGACTYRVWVTPALAGGGRRAFSAAFCRSRCWALALTLPCLTQIPRVRLTLPRNDEGLCAAAGRHADPRLLCA